MSLRCENLVVEYANGGRAVRPVDGLSMDVRKGELALLVGASGCGKTSVLSALASILRPARGSISLEGLEITGLASTDVTEYRRRMVGLVFQAFNLVPSLTAAENVQVPLRAAGVDRRRARRRADELLMRVGLRDRRSHTPGRLSGGEQQRVAIARALALDPPLVLADEPTAHLDPAHVDNVVGLFREIADEGRIVVVATHDERMVPAADRVIALDKGRVREQPELRVVSGSLSVPESVPSSLAACAASPRPQAGTRLPLSTVDSRSESWFSHPAPA